MARIHYNVKARQRYATVPVIDPETGEQAVTPVMRNGEPKRTKAGRPIVMRRTRADRTRPLPPYTCGHCGKPIAVGTRYKHVSIKPGPYGGTTLRRHQDCPTWRTSELTTSKMAGVYAAQEDFGDFLGTDFTEADEVRDALSTAAEGIRGVAEEYRESADNIVSGFGHETWQSDELVEKADELEDWAGEIEDTDVPERAVDDEEPGEDEELDLDAWRDEVRDATAIVEDCPV